MLRAVRSPDPRPDHQDAPRSLRAWWAGGLVVAVTAAAVLPPSAVSGGPTICPFRLLTGLPCPACGLTRSWAHAAHGDLSGAFALHPLGPVTLAAAVVAVLLVLLRRRLPSGRPARLLTVVLAAVLAAYGVTRMVLVARGTWANPY
ncbi:DUF2752 domain-containing protein [Luteipulveratus sp. YIM 133132]|uniref:DUF2752 domain-containing protein n=1 Tax=Luteipulveratus flavus TaxID=3031728 RepID=UPI0023AF4520|nr:DUF2752 domain-containing protein [Luteipulveratus sp. YIM 133132]MDE9366874.1 DUF2752 domain-containing protein [Luteipulveratus sp. YIM 133132]